MTPLEKAINKASELLAKREDENEYHLHDVDRKWVIEAMMDYAEYVLSGMSEKPTSSQTEISDEEIEEMLFHHSNEYAYGFKDAIKWYREQLKAKPWTPKEGKPYDWFNEEYAMEKFKEQLKSR